MKSARVSSLLFLIALLGLALPISVKADDAEAADADDGNSDATNKFSSSSSSSSSSSLCSVNSIQIANQHVSGDSSTGALTLTGDVTFTDETASSLVTVKVYGNSIDVDLCDGAVNADGEAVENCPGECVDNSCSVSQQIMTIPKAYISYMKMMSSISAGIYQDGEKITSCKFNLSVVTAQMWKGSFLTMGVMVAALGAGLVWRHKKRSIAIIDINDDHPASFVDVADGSATADDVGAMA